MTKKVLLSAYACSPNMGSEHGNGWSWAKNLAQLGYETWCFTNIEAKTEIEFEKNKLNLNNLHFIYIHLPWGLDKLLLNTSSKKIYLHYYLWKLAASKVCMRFHKTIQFDIAHHVTYGSLQQGTFLWKLNNIKIIFGPVGGGQFANKRLKEYFGKSWNIEILRGFISKWMMRYSINTVNTLKKADVILVTNKETRDLIHKSTLYTNQNIQLELDSAVPQMMSNVKFTSREKSKTLKLLWVGRILPRKGLNLVLHALSFLPEDTDYSLTIVGGGKLFALIENWIELYKLNKDRIRIVGQISFLDICHYYRISDIFIFCSLRDSCPSQLLEAMAYSLPIITLNIHGQALAVPDNAGIKVIPTDPETTAKDIANAILKMDNDKLFRNSCSVNSYNHATKNSWQKKVLSITNNYY